MKKWLKTLVVASAFIFMGALCSGFHSSEPPMIAYAEGEEVFEEKTYTYVEEGKGEATIVLTSETECVMTLVEEGKEPVSYNCTYTLEGDVLTFKYATFSETVVLNNENMTFGEYIEVTKDDWFEEKWDTYIAPLFGGVSITAIVSAVLCFVLNHIKNKGFDKKISDMEKRALVREEEANKKLAMAQECLNSYKAMFELVKESNGIDKQTKEAIENGLKDMKEKIDNIDNKSDKLEGLKQAVACLAVILAKAVENSPELIKAGIVPEVNNLKQKVAKL